MPRLLCIEERTGNEISHEHSIKFSAHGASFMAGFPRDLLRQRVRGSRAEQRHSFISILGPLGATVPFEGQHLSSIPSTNRFRVSGSL